MSEEAVYTLRPYRPSDINLIQNSWASSYYKGADYRDFMSPKEFNEKHRPIREEILRRPNIALIVACDMKDDDLILGWILVEKSHVSYLIIHYIYVKQAFKGEGIWKELLSKALPTKPVMVSHMTDRARKIIKKKKDFFKDYFYAPETIMVRDKYQEALPRSEQWFIMNGEK